MAVTRSGEYYLPYGDLFIQIEDTLFRLYRGLLELHSGFFSDMFSSPSSDGQEGTSDEHPLRLPKDLCSVESFTTLCKLICPKLTDVFPPILLKDFAVWEPVLEATEALQMTRVRNYILARFQDDEADVKTEPARLLGWALRSEFPLETLKLKCFYILVYRRRPLSEAEVDVIGSKATSLVMLARERIRGLFLSISKPTESLMEYIPTDPQCRTKSDCQRILFEEVTRNITKCAPSSDSGAEQNNLDIFQVSIFDILGMCYSYQCASDSNLGKISSSLRKAKLDDEVRRCVLGT